MTRRRFGDSLVPHSCVVLAVDCAQSSGWSIWRSGEPEAHGHVDMLASPEAGRTPCEHAVSLAHSCGMPAVLVFERPFRGTSQGAWIGAWKQRWVAAGGVKSRMMGVWPSTWRSRVLGRGWGSARRETARAREQAFALELASPHAHKFGRPELAQHPDVAPAICIAKWAMHAGEVLAKLPARKARRA